MQSRSHANKLRHEFSCFLYIQDGERTQDHVEKKVKFNKKKRGKLIVKWKLLWWDWRSLMKKWNSHRMRSDHENARVVDNGPVRAIVGQVTVWLAKAVFLPPWVISQTPSFSISKIAFTEFRIVHSISFKWAASREKGPYAIFFFQKQAFGLILFLTLPRIQENKPFAKVLPRTWVMAVFVLER